MDDKPEFFVARDRARRLGFRLEKVLQERRLAWRGEDVGMSTLRDEADLDLLAIARDARESAAAVLAGRLRDRERGYMEMPFVVAVTGVAHRLEEAAALEADRRGGRGGEEETRAAILDRLTAAAERLEAFQAAYDAKRILGEPGPVDVARLLGALARPGAAPYDRAPPVLTSDRAGLGDLLLAIRTALGETVGGWHVALHEGDRAVRLVLGDVGGETRPGPLPEEVERAADVLAWLHPVEVAARVRPRALGGDELAGVAVGLEDPAAKSLDLSLEALSGGRPALTPQEEAAVRRLLQSPAHPESGPPSPPRLVALLGLLQAFDAALSEGLLPRLTARAVRRAAAELPREATRKAPLKRSLLAALAAELPGVAFDRAGDLARGIERAQKGPRIGPGEAAALLALFGRSWSHAGTRGTAPLPRGTLDDADVERLIGDLASIAAIRPRLDAGQDVSPHEITRLEAAAIGALGRIRRM